MTDFFTSLENTSETSRFRKLFSKDPIVGGTIKNTNGSWMDTLNLLMEILFLDV